MFDTNEQDALSKLAQWGNQNDNVRAMILTSSRVSKSSKPDNLSDYDVELIVSDLQPFNSDDWLDYFGKTLVKWPLIARNADFAPGSITRLVVFKDFPRVDFQIIGKQYFDGTSYDNGYKIILDKDNIESKIVNPTLKKYIVAKPIEQDFYETVDGFYWDLPYIAKSLRRGEIAFARYMLLSAIRYESFDRMLSWYVGLHNNWSVNYGVHGRNLEKLINKYFASEINSISATGDEIEIWQATLDMVNIFDKMTQEVGEELGYVEEPVNKKAVLVLCEDMLNLNL
jgi:aminoglycoside 6-adenylyltransferase